MNRLYAAALVLVALLAPSAVLAHDARLHKGNATIGDVVSVSADSFELKTKTETLKVTFSKTTKFEHGDATVDKSHLTKGGHVAVFGTKLPTGELVAKEILLGVEDAQHPIGKASPEHKH